MSRRRAKKKNCPATNAAGLRRSLLAVDGDAIKLHTVINQSISKPLSDNLLQCLKLRVDEFDDLAGFDVDQMVVMRFRRCFITGAAVTEIVAVQYPCLFEKADSSVYGGNRNFGVDCRRTAIQLLNIGVVGCIGNDARDDATLVRNAQAPVVAERLNVDFDIHPNRHLVSPYDSSKKKAREVPGLIFLQISKKLILPFSFGRAGRAPKANRLGQFAALFGVSRGNHWIIGW